MIKAAIVGATGYTGMEIAEILIRHPEIEITSLSALVEEEMPFSDIYPRFKGRLDLLCKNMDKEEIINNSDVVFLALPHTVSMKFAPEFLKAGLKVIDLSADYRLPKEDFEKWYSSVHLHPEGIEQAVYGLPEINREKIASTRLLANPGCYPTSVILGLKPISEMISGSEVNIIIDSKTGITGAGRKASIPLSFSEADGNFKSYKMNDHQHMPEMEHILSGCAGRDVKVNFVPHLLPAKRGIFSTIYLTGLRISTSELFDVYASDYANEPFVRIKSSTPQLSDVVGTNFCDISVLSKGGITIIVSAIDNLMKGASGQAVQNMNIMFSFEEKLALA